MLVETRKYIETRADDFQARYELLKMYCDWAVHIELHSNRHLIEMLKTFDEDVSGSSIDTRAFLKYSTLTEFKEEFGRFLREVGLQDITADVPKWRRFLRDYSEVVAECPLYTNRKGARLQNIRKISLQKEPDLSGLQKGVAALYRSFIDQFDVWLDWQIELLDGTVTFTSVMGPQSEIEKELSRDFRRPT
jgi:hypothetical protein